MEILHIFVLFVISIASAIYAYFHYYFNYWKVRNIPHIKPKFPYGNVKGIGTEQHQSAILQDMYKRFKGTAKFCGVYFFSRPIVMTLDLDLIKSILIRDFTNFNDRGVFYNEKDDPLSAHLFSLDGGKWKKLRAKLTPTFTSGKMKFMYPTIVEVGERFRDHLKVIVKDHNVLEIKELLARFTTDVIGTCAFGIECNSLEDENAEFRKMGKAVFEQPRHGIAVSILIGGFRDLSRRFGIKLVRDDVAKFFMNVVRETVEYREKNNVQRNDFMDLLIKLKNEETSDASKAVTLNEIAAQAFVFFLAGFETSSTTLGFCLYELAMNPDVQEKTRKEIRNALKKHDGKFTYETMLDMPYVDHVIDETLRKYPPVAVLFRRAQNNYTVPGTNDVIEKGTTIFIPVHSIQNDPEYFPEPDKFNPDRFESEEVRKRNLMTWLPFGEGPRNCIGLRFGMMQARIGLVMLLNNFEFSTCDKTSIPLVIQPRSFILTPTGGVYLKLKPIESEYI